MIFDYNIFKWSWTQRIIAVMMIVTYRFLMCKPYAMLHTDTFTKYYTPKLNIFAWATMGCLLASAMYCFGMYRWKVLNLLAGTGGCELANLLFILLGYIKDKRMPTSTTFIALGCILLTAGCIFLYSKTYRVITKSELLKEEKGKM